MYFVESNLTKEIFYYIFFFFLHQIYRNSPSLLFKAYLCVWERERTIVKCDLFSPKNLLHICVQRFTFFFLLFLPIFSPKLIEKKKMANESLISSTIDNRELRDYKKKKNKKNYVAFIFFSLLVSISIDYLIIAFCIIFSHLTKFCFNLYFFFLYQSLD